MRIILVSILIAIIIFLAGTFSAQPSSQLKMISNTISSIFPVRIGDPVKPAESSSVLKNLITEDIHDEKGKYGVSVLNLKTGEFVNLNETEKFQSASLYKLWVMAVTFQKIEDGDLKKDQLLSESIQGINKYFDIPPQYAEQARGTLSITVEEALERMITASDNYSALLLAKTIGLSNIDEFLDKYGLSDSSFGKDTQFPVTTAKDTAMFFDLLYKGKLANPEYTNSMLDLLKAQKLNHKLPKLLPKDTVIAHKTGELDFVTHDAGIVYIENGPYIISVLSETPAPGMAEGVLANISKTVFSFFTKDK